MTLRDKHEQKLINDYGKDVADRVSTEEVCALLHAWRTCQAFWIKAASTLMEIEAKISEAINADSEPDALWDRRDEELYKFIDFIKQQKHHEARTREERTS